MPPPQRRHVKEDICIISNDDDFLFIPHKNKGKQPSVTKLSISKNNSCVQHALKEKPKIPTQTKISTPLFGSQSTTNLSTANPQQNLMDLSKVEMEAKALTIVKTFTIKGDCELFSLPKEVSMSRLFALLSQTNTVMDMTLLQDPKAYMAILMNMETIGTLCNNLVVAFGYWYLYLIVSLHLPSIHV